MSDPTLEHPMVLRSACRHGRCTTPCHPSPLHEDHQNKVHHSHENGFFREFEHNSNDCSTATLKHRATRLEKSAHLYSYTAVTSKYFNSTSEGLFGRSGSHSLSYLQGSTDIAATVAEKLKYTSVSKDCSGSHSDTSGAERDLNDNIPCQFMKSTSEMARTSLNVRQSVSSVRALSGSDYDNDTSTVRQESHHEYMSPQLRSVSQSSSNNRQRVMNNVSSMRDSSHAENHVREATCKSGPMWEGSTSGSVETGNQSFSGDSSMTELCTEKGIFLYRWLMWKYTYLAICKCMHFDIKTLTRMATFGKKKIIFFMLLPLFLWMLSGLYFREASQSHFSSQLDFLRNSVVPSVGALLTYVLPVSKLKHDLDSKHGQNIHSLASWWPFQRDGATTHAEKPTSAQPSITGKLSSPPSITISKAEVKSLVEEVLKEVGDLPQYSSRRHGTSFDQKPEEIEKIQAEMKSFHSEFESLAAVLQSFKANVDGKLKTSEQLRQFSVEQEMKLLHIDTKLQTLGEKFLLLENRIHSFQNCCQNHSDYFSLLEMHLSSLLSTISEGDDKTVHPSIKNFHNWLKSHFVNSHKFSSEIDKLREKIKEFSLPSAQQYEDLAKSTAAAIVTQYIDSLQKSHLTENKNTYEEQGNVFLARVHKIVKDALLLYDADKTGQTDYALESGGGSVVNTRCSETYSERSPRITILGFPLGFGSSTPRNAIQPDVHPGQCWAFKGSQGFLVIQLAATIKPTGFVIEHISKSLSPTGTVNSAPKEFTVWGLASEKDNEGQLLGKYIYDKDGDPLQYFPTQVNDNKFYSYIELKIHSNHGDLEYTCLYRFRVHGSRY